MHEPWHDRLHQPGAQPRSIVHIRSDRVQRYTQLRGQSAAYRLALEPVARPGIQAERHLAF